MQIIFSILFCFVVSIGAQEVVIQKTSDELAREKLLTIFAGEWVSRGVYVAT